MEGDPFYAVLHRAVCRSMACRLAKRALRMLQALKPILDACDKDGAQWLEVAAVIALGYVFGVRVPSELLRQNRAALWKLEAATVHYGLVKRKHRDWPVILARSCVCVSRSSCFVSSCVGALCGRPLAAGSKLHHVGGRLQQTMPYFGRRAVS